MPLDKMNCSFCDSDNSEGIKGSGQFFICFRCIGELSFQNKIEVEGVCSGCGSKIGRVKGLLRRRKIGAVAVNYATGTILCNECGKLCHDIMKEKSTA